MAIRTPLTTLLATALLVVVAAAQQPQIPIFRSGTEIVDLYVTATDKNGRLVPTLVQEDFVILDEEEAQEIVLFENEVRPITVVVMLDTSASMTPSLELLMAGAEQFLIRMLPEDRAKVGAFNDKIQILPSQFIGDRDALIRQLDQLQFGNPTRLYDAVGASIDELQGVEGRKVVLVFTDGADTQHAIGWRDVLDKARAAEVMIYTIGLEMDYFNGVRQVRSKPDKRLKTFAEETGGGYFELKDSDELGPTFTRVAQELHSQYVLGFSPQVELAVTTMLEAHQLNRRKAGQSFEATHALAVAMIVGDFGFGERAVVSAVLHDTLEDTTLERAVIRERFGGRVLAIVADVTEPPRTVPWRNRKESYIERLRRSPEDDARAVASADKIHNLASMVTGLEAEGLPFADIFSAGLDDMVWYQRQVHEMLSQAWSHPILNEHGRQLDRFLAATQDAQ